jgi:hypothetical protein
VLEVYEYRVTCYDHETGEGGLFVDYIITFLKLKVEACGYPSRVRTEKDEVQYINQFHQDEGVRLDRACISYNAAKRGLAKLCLNSMWGKLTERRNRTHTKLISEPAELYRFLVTPGVEVQNMLFSGDDVVCISWQYSADDRVPSLRHTNEVIGAYVTAGARIHLYGFLDKLQKRPSTRTLTVIFIQPTNVPYVIEMGNNLGQKQSGLKGYEIIVDVVCDGPKN